MSRAYSARKKQKRAIKKLYARAHDLGFTKGGQICVEKDRVESVAKSKPNAVTSFVGRVKKACNKFQLKT